MIDLIRALAAYADPPTTDNGPVAAALGLPIPTPSEHANLFLLELFPYASVHLDTDGKVGGDALDRVAGFFRALGATPATPPDRLGALLCAYAELLEREEWSQDDGETGFWARARSGLLVEHVLSWVPALLNRVHDLGGPGYRGWAEVLDEVLAAEASRTPATAGILPVHLQIEDRVPDPRTSPVSAFVEGLLAPVRAGVILTSSDLMSASRTLGLGRRIGERRFVMRSLLDQDPAGLLDWLSNACFAEAARWDRHWLARTPTGEAWRARAAHTGDLLAELAGDAANVQLGRDSSERQMTTPRMG